MPACPDGQSRVERLTDRGRLRPLLEADRIWSAYALADLQDGFFEESEWYRSGAGLAMIYSGFRPPVLFTDGPASDVRDILLDVSPALKQVVLSIRAEHLDALSGLFDTPQPIPMWRMALNPALFPARPKPEVVRLGRESIEEIYALFEGAADAPDAFAPEQVERGVFFGVRAEGGRLEAVAGTHILALEESVGAVGNVFVRPGQRGKGSGKQVAWAVTDELLKGRFRTIVLNVSQQNAGAIKLYEQLGYRRYCAFYEGISKSTMGANA